MKTPVLMFCPNVTSLAINVRLAIESNPNLHISPIKKFACDCGVRVANRLDDNDSLDTVKIFVVCAFCFIKYEYNQT